MTKEQAEELYALVNHPGWLSLVEYKTDILAEIHKELEWAKPEDVKHHQGRIVEIRRDLALKKAVLEFLDIK